MKKVSPVDFGEYYRNPETNLLVRAIGRAYDANMANSMIIYCYIQQGGYASELFYMPEQEFISKFVF